MRKEAEKQRIIMVLSISKILKQTWTLKQNHVAEQRYFVRHNSTLAIRLVVKLLDQF
jgi:hypothetical protein